MDTCVFVCLKCIFARAVFGDYLADSIRLVVCLSVAVRYTVHSTRTPEKPKTL